MSAQHHLVHPQRKPVSFIQQDALHAEAESTESELASIPKLDHKASVLYIEEEEDASRKCDSSFQSQVPTFPLQQNTSLNH
ncbi:hypothetical protein Bpfe_007460 [Biomphalaria pfeifferi]|uniref:Uncharacterized protein n=1 Tax=Biomphalaria pfeifferi TaxID=112525 RepID=A0AAD8C0N3_BIOPF|nr:hypothetical protein Bpfe_007460 [Biomphalaria pfeifferi]